MPSLALQQPSGPARKLSALGREKLRHFVANASSLDDLAAVESALDGGRLSDALAARLQLGEVDFEAEAPALEPRPLPYVEPPLGALGLTASGLLKARRAVEGAADMRVLGLVDRALRQGDIPRLRRLLELKEEDLQGGGELPATPPLEIKGEAPLSPREDAGEAPTSPLEEGKEEAPTSSLEEETEDEDYDPFASEPAVTVVAAAPPRPKKPVLAALSAYEDSASESEQPPAKRCKEEPARPLPWPIGWAWLVSRTRSHPDFRPPELTASTTWATASTAPAPTPAPILAIATSRVYVGEPASGYDPHHLARVVVVDANGEVVLDRVVRPQAPLLDVRMHITGLTREALLGETAVAPAAVRSELLQRFTSDALIVGYRVSGDLQALQLWHGPLVDVALLFAVESRKKHQQHPLKHLAQHVLKETEPQGALEAARLVMRLAQLEAGRAEPTPPFPPAGDSGCELLVRHIPYAWGRSASTRLAALCPGAEQSPTVRWNLNEVDPTDWRGEALLSFPSTAARESCFEALQGLTDVHVQWQEVEGAPPLGAFLTEQALVKAFSSFGVVVAARLPRKAATREPQPFAFVSFLQREDAQRAARKPRVEVQITPSWVLPLRPRVARLGNEMDKRVAVKTAEGEWGGLDWVHICKR